MRLSADNNLNGSRTAVEKSSILLQIEQAAGLYFHQSTFNRVFDTFSPIKVTHLFIRVFYHHT